MPDIAPTETIKRLEAKNAKMSKIIEVVKVLSRQNSLDDLLSTIIKETTNILEADRTSLFIYDKKTDELWSKISEKWSGREIRFGTDKGIAGYVARTRNIVNIKNVYENELFNPAIDLVTGFRTQNVLCFPMESYTGKLIGVIEVMNKKTADSFEKEDEEILDTFSSLVAVLIENAILEKVNAEIERMATIGNMANSIVHDIKNPMSTIRGYAQLIMIKSPELSKEATIITSEIDRLTNMTNEVLEFSKGISNKMTFETVTCDHFFTTIFDFLKRDFEENSIDYSHSIEYTGKIEINPDKIRRAIFNIAGNALDAMGSGGSFNIKICEANESRGIIISIMDTGKGMPPEIKNTVFEAFVTHDKKHGTGLGMAITKKIIDAHNGIIEVESEEGKGTKFEIRLPKSQYRNPEQNGCINK